MPTRATSSAQGSDGTSRSSAPFRNRISTSCGLKPNEIVNPATAPPPRYAHNGLFVPSVSRQSAVPLATRTTSLPLDPSLGDYDRRVIFVVPSLDNNKLAYQTLVTPEGKKRFDEGTSGWEGSAQNAEYYYRKYCASRDTHHHAESSAEAFGEVLAADLSLLRWGSYGLPLRAVSITPADRDLLLSPPYKFEDPQNVSAVFRERDDTSFAPQIIRVLPQSEDDISRHYIVVSSRLDSHGQLKANALLALPQDPDFLTSISANQIRFIDNLESTVQDAVNAFEAFQLQVPDDLREYATARGCTGDIWDTEAGEILAEFVKANISRVLQTLSADTNKHIVVAKGYHWAIDEQCASGWLDPSLLTKHNDHSAWGEVLGTYIEHFAKDKSESPPEYEALEGLPSY